MYSFLSKIDLLKFCVHIRDINLYCILVLYPNSFIHENHVSFFDDRPYDNGTIHF
jgi:hypothetical protein